MARGATASTTQHLLASLRQPDTDILKVFQRTQAGVVRDTGGKQTPWESTSLTGDFYFRPGTQVASAAPAASAVPAPAAAATDAQTELAPWESVKDSRSADELRAYLEQYPDGKFAGVARARIKSLATPTVQVTQPQSVPAAGIGSISGAAPGSTFKDCDVCPEMVVISAGSYMMGSPASEQGREGDEGPQHQVTISRKFAAGKYEVTFDEWDACVRENMCGSGAGDSGWGRGKRPAINVSWNDAKQYTWWLSHKTGRNYRLLTEAEWEYVARAGTSTPFNTGASINPQQANYDTAVSFGGSPTATTPRQTAPVGSYAANAFGLYDVHGNVWEWVEDCYNASYNGAPTDGSAWTAGDCGQRVLCGGSWSSNPQRLRSAMRLWNITSNRSFLNGGLRVARTD